MKVHHLNCGTMNMPTAPMVCHVLLVETDNGLVLIDSGYGSHDCLRPAKRVGPTRHLIRPVFDHRETAGHHVERLGFRPNDVRHIIITHFDADHIGAALDRWKKDVPDWKREGGDTLDRNLASIRAKVEKIEREVRQGAQGWRVTTSRGALWARDVFAGTSGYTGAATPTLQKKIIPLGSYIITTEVLPEALARELSPRNRMIYDSKNYLYYYRLTPDNRMLFGGRAAFFPETADSIRKSAKILRRGMIDVYPQLRDVKVEYVWGGTLDFAFDIMPHAGQIDHIYYALGYAGHGVAMATWQGQKMAELIAGEKPENPFVDIPFPGAPLGLYNGKPWFLPFAGAWYKVLDWVS